MRRPLVLAALVLVCAAASARADSPRQHVTVHMDGGRPITGVVLAQDVWEKQDAKGQWLPAKKDEPGAGVRVWYVGGLDGFLFVTAAKVTDLKFQGEFTDAEAKKLKKDTADAQARSDAERKRLADEKVRRAAEAKGSEGKGDAAKGDAGKGDAAKGDAAKGEAPKPAKPPEAPKPVNTRSQELLTKYPPGKWKLTTPEEVQKRFIVSHLPATAEETAFIASFSEWKVAYEAWLLSNPQK